MTPSIPDDLRAALLAAGLPPGTHIVAAVSGGPDSVALLHALNALREEQGWTLTVAHVDHGLRGEESRQDAEFTGRLGERLGLPVVIRSVDVQGETNEGGRSLEMAAREARRAALLDTMASTGAAIITTGHTMDDQAETFLMRAMRGAGTQGLGGIRLSSGPFRRPFLPVRRERLLAYLQHIGEGYRLDSSNLDRRHLRNRLRHDLMPQLTAVQPHAVEALARTASLAAADASLIDSLVRSVLPSLGYRASDGRRSVSLSALRALDGALAAHVVRALAHEIIRPGDHLDADRLDEILAAVQRGKVAVLGHCLPGPATAWLEDDRLILMSTSPATAEQLLSVELSLPGITELPGGSIEARLLDAPGWDEVSRWLEVRGPTCAIIDADAVEKPAVIRARRPGDRVHPLGGRGERKVQDVLVDGHVPRALRDLVPILEMGGRVAWIAGICQAEWTRVTPESRRLLALIYRPQPGG